MPQSSSRWTAGAAANGHLLYPLGDLPGVDAKNLRDTVETAIRAYRKTSPLDRHRLLDRYRLVDVAHEVVGVGSAGPRALIVLMRGRSDDDLLILQAKEVEASVLEAHLGRSEFRWPGERVVQGQRLMQAASDISLGWLGAPGQPADYVRRLRDWKAGVGVAGLDAAGLGTYARACGWTLARVHARSGEPAEISGYLGSSDRFDGAIADFAETYADQNESDHQTFLEQVKNGRIAATTGV